MNTSIPTSQITTLSELELPKSNIQRSIKNVIGNKMVQKEAKIAISKAVVVFVSYLTCRAHSSSTQRTFTKTQIEAALLDCGFDVDYLPLIEEKYKLHIERQSLKKMKATSTKKIDTLNDDDEAVVNEEEDEDDDASIVNNNANDNDEEDPIDEETQIQEEEDDMKVDY